MFFKLLFWSIARVTYAAAHRTGVIHYQYYVCI